MIIAFAFLAGLWRLTKYLDKDIQLTQEQIAGDLRFFQRERDRKKEIESEKWTKKDVTKLVKAMFISPKE